MRILEIGLAGKRSGSKKLKSIKTSMDCIAAILVNGKFILVGTEYKSRQTHGTLQIEITNNITSGCVFRKVMWCNYKLDACIPSQYEKIQILHHCSVLNFDLMLLLVGEKNA